MMWRLPSATGIMPSEKRPKIFPQRRVQEEPGEIYPAQGRPETKLQVLVLEERDDCLFQAARALTAAGHTPHAVHDEELAIAEILAGENIHFLLLTAYPTRRPLSIPQTIERLRQSGYRRTISYCAKGEILPETRTAYEALAVDRVLGLPPRARRSVLTALAWLGGQVPFDAEGLTILESV